MEDRDTLTPMAAINVRAPKAAGGGVFNYIASSEAQDSFGTRIRVKGWDLTRFSGRKNGAKSIGPTKGNPVIMWAHDYDVPPIGRGLSIVKNLDRLTLDLGMRFLEADEFGGEDNWPARAPNPLATRAMVEAGVLKGSSVGFFPGETESMPEDEDERMGRHGFFEPEVLTKGHSLIEVSIVPIPSNPDALQEGMSKGWLQKSHLPAILEVLETWRRDLNVAGLGLGDDLCDLMHREIGAPRSGVELPRAQGYLTVQSRMDDGERQEFHDAWDMARGGSAILTGLSLDDLRGMIREEVAEALAPETEQDQPEPAAGPAPEGRSMDTAESEDNELLEYLRSPFPTVTLKE